MATSGPGSCWHTLKWFQMVWFAAENQEGAAEGRGRAVTQAIDIRPGGTAWQYKRALESGDLSDSGHLAWYLVLLQNVFGHVLPGSGEGLARGLAFMHDSPVAQPTSQVVQRFRNILAVNSSPGWDGGDDRFFQDGSGRTSSQGSNVEGSTHNSGSQVGRGRGRSRGLGGDGRSRARGGGGRRTDIGRSGALCQRSAMLPSTSQWLKPIEYNQPASQMYAQRCSGIHGHRGPVKASSAPNYRPLQAVAHNPPCFIPRWL